MFLRSFRFHYVVSLALLFMLSSLPALAADIAVGAGSACTLADAIRAANTDSAVGGCPAAYGQDTITLTSDITLNDKLPAVRSHLTINGNGRTISAGTRHRILKLKDGGILELRDLTLYQGYTARAPGAALYIENGNAELSNVRITDSLNESGYGGAVGVANGSLVCNSCTFDDNLGVTGGAIWVGSGGSVTLNNSRINNNSAQQGGAIYVDGGSLSVNGTQVNGNDAGYGAGIFSNGGSITVCNFSQVSNNYASGHGGGIYADGGRVVIADVRMRGNQAVSGQDIYADADLYIYWPNDMAYWDGIVHIP